MTTPVDDQLTEARIEKHDLIIELLQDIFRRLERLEANNVLPNADGYRFIKHPDLADASTALVAALVRAFDAKTITGLPIECAQVALALGFKTARDALDHVKMGPTKRKKKKGDTRPDDSAFEVNLG